LRLALLLKSFIGYFDALGKSSEAVAVYGMSELRERAMRQGLGQSVAETGELREKLLGLLSSDDVADLVNPEILEMLNENDPVLAVRNAQEVYEAIALFGKFTTENQKIFLRPGIFDFKAVAKKLGRIGSFYAGYEPIDRDALRGWLDQCADGDSRESYWDVVAKKSIGSTTCGEEFSRIVLDYREKLLANEAGFPSRINEPVGSVIPMLISTSIIHGSRHVSEIKEQQARYLKNLSAQISPGLANLRFGYWGNSQSVAALDANAPGYGDLRTKKRLNLGTTSWEKILSLSPAEPGLAKIQVINEELASAGGWSDLSPTQVLDMLGCERVIYVTRRGEETPFASGIASLLGVSNEEIRDLYSLDNPESSFSVSLRRASGVWCTDWNRFKDTEFLPMALESYRADFLTADESFSRNVLKPYGGLVQSGEIKGCSDMTAHR